ncbi:type II toxin-antitoxin system Phd/YefM family antitoxin [Epibacterium sp. DP7N7-1]|nr:type II toxin-antitoxin system Phd/YefM family antitoxin [Epibacterium sp. DP7N7-1]
MTQVTSAEIQKHFGTYKREALNDPIEITIHGKPTLVLMSHNRYQKLLELEAKEMNSAKNKQDESVPDLADELEELERIASGTGGVRFADDPIND